MKTELNGMEEVLALESVIRAALPKATGRVAIDAKAIMAGKYAYSGTRLAALRALAGRLS